MPSESQSEAQPASPRLSRPRSPSRRKRRSTKSSSRDRAFDRIRSRSGCRCFPSASEDYEASGATSIADYIQKLPIAGSAINRTNNSSGNLGFPPDGGGIGAGAAEIDLRYLASKRVLVLVDGRRWVKGSSGSGVSGAVDLNSIPASAIKSIEILQDGASAVYGSDAIGGVLNVITADDYDTFKISGYTGQYSDGDGETSEFDMRMGGDGERGRALVSLSYNNQKEVNTADRKESELALPGFPFGISGGIAPGRANFFDPVLGDFVDVVPENTNPMYTPGDPNGGDFHEFSNADRFNYQPLQPPGDAERALQRIRQG